MKYWSCVFLVLSALFQNCNGCQNVRDSDNPSETNPYPKTLSVQEKELINSIKDKELKEHIEKISKGLSSPSFSSYYIRKALEEDEDSEEKIIKILEILLAHGATINQHDNTLLSMALEEQKEKVALFLLEQFNNTIDVNAIASSGQAPIHIAVGMSSATMVKALLDKGAKLNTPTTDKYFALNEGGTPLHALIVHTFGRMTYTQAHRQLTVEANSPEERKKILDLLLSQPGVDVNAKDKTGQTPLDLLERHAQIAQDDLRSSHTEIQKSASNHQDFLNYARLQLTAKGAKHSTYLP